MFNSFRFKKNDILKNLSSELLIEELKKIEPADIAALKALKNHQKLIRIKLSDEPDDNFLLLETALKSADFILAEDYYKSRNNMLSLALCLEKYKILTEYAVILPPIISVDNDNKDNKDNKDAEQWDLLVKTSEMSKKLKQDKALSAYSYKELEPFYDDGYYLNDCGGYKTFKLNRETMDERLCVVNSIVNPQKNEKILDLGCGRGELSYAMAKAGADVLGIDYSQSSINIAEKNFNGKLKNLKFKKIDFFKLDNELLFDKIVAADLIEHIDPELADKFMKQIKNHLNKNGKFILHTGPNKYIYSYKYKRDRKKAIDLGLYLPENPRSFYETIMHVNEQTPGSLKKLLKKYFNYFYVWTGNIDEPLGNLIKKPLKSEMIKHESIFAVAEGSSKHARDTGERRTESRTCECETLKKEIISSLTQDELRDISGISIELLPESVYNYSTLLKKNTNYSFKLKVINNSSNILRSVGRKAVNLSYHIKAQDGNYIVYDGVRTKPLFAIYPGTHVETEFNVGIPDIVGSGLQLEFTMVQENVFWFEDKNARFSKSITIDVW